MIKIIATAILASSLAVAWAAGDAAAGKAVYDRSCKNCHGANGVANPNIAKMLKVEMKPLGSSEVQSMSDQQLQEIISKGKGKMPPVRNLKASQVNDVIAYVRTFKK